MTEQAISPLRRRMIEDMSIRKLAPNVFAGLFDDHSIKITICIVAHLHIMRGAMNVTLLRSMVVLVPVCMLLFGSAVMFIRGKTVPSLLQLLGAGCLVLVVLTHVAEALHLFPWMHWGEEQSVGHYLDFGSAVLGFILFTVGYLFHAICGDRLTTSKNQ